jgi:hypothetical protein
MTLIGGNVAAQIYDGPSTVIRWRLEIPRPRPHALIIT